MSKEKEEKKGKEFKEKAESLKKEFVDFAFKGNVFDMAIGVIIGGAFGKIVTSLVEDIIIPIISMLTGRVNIADLKFVKDLGEMGKLELPYGMFLQNVLNFFIIAFCIFIMFKLVSKVTRKLKREEEKKETVAPVITNEEKLLTEIRDLLAKK